MAEVVGGQLNYEGNNILIIVLFRQGKQNGMEENIRVSYVSYYDTL